jgi:hypothetical protein
MPVGLPLKIAALFAAMETKDLDEMSPAERRRFADVCRHWAAVAARGEKDAPRAGFIAELADGRGRE